MAALLYPASQALRLNADHRHLALASPSSAAFRCKSYYFNQDPSSGRNPKFKSNTKLKSKRSPSGKNLELVIDLDRIKRDAVLNFESAKRTGEYKLRRFVNSGMDAFDDLRTMVVVDDGRRVVLSCRRSTVEFVGSMVLWSFLVWLGMKMLMEVGLGFKLGLGFGGGQTVRRRDRSLGGREVVVAAAQGRKEKRNESTRDLVTPLSPSYEALLKELEMGVQGPRREEMEFVGGQSRIRREEKLPSWVPVSVPQPTVVAVNEEGQRMANRLIRAIMDAKVGGQDVCEDDIIELRRICRVSGARVNIDTANARDSLYRTSVDFVLHICSRMPIHSTSVQIDGEDPRMFIAGLADNLGIENTRAARMVTAAVAAHTRSCIVQGWALEMQKKHMEAVAELSKICILHQIFPPEESSPEMEMVARGLAHHLSVENRKFLLSILAGICGIERGGSMAEALGLEISKPAESEPEPVTPPSQS